MRKELGEVLVTFKNLLTTVMIKSPILILVIIYILDLVLRGYLAEGFSKMFLMMALISLVSMGIYISNGSFSETTLSFILGVLTIYTIDWEKSNIVLFLSFYLIYLVFVFYIKNVKIISKQETILSQAASKLVNEKNYDIVYKELKKISINSTDANQLTIIQKSEVIRYLSYRHMSIGEIQESIEGIELIYCICQINLLDACEVYYSLYLYSKNISKRGSSTKSAIEFFELIMSVPLLYTEFFSIFKYTKRLLYEGLYTFENYIIKIKEYALCGYAENEIIEYLLKSNTSTSHNFEFTK